LVGALLQRSKPRSELVDGLRCRERSGSLPLGLPFEDQGMALPLSSGGARRTRRVS
jgi:hypothetical protein